MLQAKTDFIQTAAAAAIWAATWPGDDNRNDRGDSGGDRWPTPDQIPGYEPADQYTDRRYDPATDNSPKRPDEDRTFWDRL
jgi:hypothetical protein